MSYNIEKYWDYEFIKLNFILFICSEHRHYPDLYINKLAKMKGYEDLTTNLIKEIFTQKT